MGIARKGRLISHLPRIGGDAEKTAVVHAKNDLEEKSVQYKPIEATPQSPSKNQPYQTKKRNRPILTKNIQQNLKHRLPKRRLQQRIEILHGKQQAKDEEKPKHKRHAHRSHDANRRGPRRILRLLGQVRARIKPRNRKLRHKYPNTSDIRRRRPLRPPCPVVESRKHKLRRLVRRCFCDDGDGKRADAEAVQEDGGIVEVFEDLDAKGVDEAVGDEEGGVDADDFGRGRGVARLYGSEGADELGAAKCYAGCYGHCCRLFRSLGLKQLDTPYFAHPGLTS